MSLNIKLSSVQKLNSIILIINIHFTTSDESDTINTFEFWNASLSYRKDEDAKFEYELKATNLLDTRSQNQSNAGNISVSATEYFIQPRFITLRIRYEL